MHPQRFHRSPKSALDMNTNAFPGLGLRTKQRPFQCNLRYIVMSVEQYRGTSISSSTTDAQLISYFSTPLAIGDFIVVEPQPIELVRLSIKDKDVQWRSLMQPTLGTGIGLQRIY